MIANFAVQDEKINVILITVGKGEKREAIRKKEIVGCEREIKERHYNVSVKVWTPAKRERR